MVIVDTCIWTDALRKKENKQSLQREYLSQIITEGRALLLNPIRQELLSGIKERKVFEKLRDRLSAFKSPQLDVPIYEVAAECFNTCRKAGIQGSNTDFLICAVAIHFSHPIFTTDGDFLFFKKVLDIKLINFDKEFSRK